MEKCRWPSWPRRRLDLGGVFFTGAGDGKRYRPLFCSTQMYSVDLTEQNLSWSRVTHTKGATPSPRNSHSCWVHRDRSVVPGQPVFQHGNPDVPSTLKDLCLLFPSFSDRLIYFGGYGCKTMGEMQNTPATNFIVEELSWVIGYFGRTAVSGTPLTLVS